MVARRADRERKNWRWRQVMRSLTLDRQRKMRSPRAGANFEADVGARAIEGKRRYKVRQRAMLEYLELES